MPFTDPSTGQTLYSYAETQPPGSASYLNEIYASYLKQTNEQNAYVAQQIEAQRLAALTEQERQNEIKVAALKAEIDQLYSAPNLHSDEGRWAHYVDLVNQYDALVPGDQQYLITNAIQGSGITNADLTRMATGGSALSSEKAAVASMGSAGASAIMSGARLVETTTPEGKTEYSLVDPRSLASVGSPEWWSYQIETREAAAKANVASAPISKSTPGYYEYIAPTYTVGTQEWYNQIFEAREYNPTAKIAQTVITPATPGYFNVIFPTLAVGTPEWINAEVYGLKSGAQGIVPLESVPITTPGYFENFYSMLKTGTPLYNVASELGVSQGKLAPTFAGKEVSPGVFLTGNVFGVLGATQGQQNVIEIAPGLYGYPGSLQVYNARGDAAVQASRDYSDKMIMESLFTAPIAAWGLGLMATTSEKAQRQYDIISGLDQPEIIKSVEKFAVGVGTALPYTAAALTLAIPGSELAARYPKEFSSMVAPAAIETGKGMYEHAVKEPVGFAGEMAGMAALSYVAPKGISYVREVSPVQVDFSGLARDISPVSLGTAEFTSTLGKESSVFYARLKSPEIGSLGDYVRVEPGFVKPYDLMALDAARTYALDVLPEKMYAGISAVERTPGAIVTGLAGTDLRMFDTARTYVLDTFPEQAYGLIEGAKTAPYVISSVAMKFGDMDLRALDAARTYALDTFPEQVYGLTQTKLGIYEPAFTSVDLKTFDAARTFVLDTMQEKMFSNRRL